MAFQALVSIISNSPEWTPMKTNPTSQEISVLSEANKSYRRVLFTSESPPRVPAGTAVQSVLMAITDYVGWEKHDANTQHFLVVSGTGLAYRDSSPDKTQAPTFQLKKGDSFFVLPGEWHDIENTSADGGLLRLVSLYYPPHHPATRHQRTRQEAEAEEEKTPE